MKKTPDVEWRRVGHRVKARPAGRKGKWSTCVVVDGAGFYSMTDGAIAMGIPRSTLSSALARGASVYNGHAIRYMRAEEAAKLLDSEYEVESTTRPPREPPGKQKRSSRRPTSSEASEFGARLKIALSILKDEDLEDQAARWMALHILEVKA